MYVCMKDLLLFAGSNNLYVRPVGGQVEDQTAIAQSTGDKYEMVGSKMDSPAMPKVVSETFVQKAPAESRHHSAGYNLSVQSEVLQLQ